MLKVDKTLEQGQWPTFLFPQELIIHIPYDALSWDYLKDESSNCLDSFCIEFDSRKDDISEPVSEQIQVLSRQVCILALFSVKDNIDEFQT